MPHPLGFGSPKGAGVDLAFYFCSPMPTIAIQPSFSTIHCKSFNIFIKMCYSFACLPSSTLAGHPAPEAFKRVIVQSCFLSPYPTIRYPTPHYLNSVVSYPYKITGGEGVLLPDTLTPGTPPL